MIVALRALHLHAQKQTRYFSRQINRVLVIAQEPVDGGVHLPRRVGLRLLQRSERVLLHAAERVLPAGAQQLKNQFIPGPIIGERFVEPAPEGHAVDDISLRRAPH